MLVLDLPGGARFPLGRVLATPGALEALGEDDETRSANLSAILSRHATGDWGDLCQEDRKANETALRRDTRILSVYTVNEQTIWIITEADRSATTALLPGEY